MSKLKYETIEEVLDGVERARRKPLSHRAMALTWALKHCQALAVRLVEGRLWYDAGRALALCEEIEDESATAHRAADAADAIADAGFVDGELRLFNDDAPGAVLLTAAYSERRGLVTVRVGEDGPALYSGPADGLLGLFSPHVHGS